jgi:hypothetical protein
MRNPWPWALLWLATVAGAWFLGSQASAPSDVAEPPPAEDAESARLRRRVADLERALAEAATPQLTGREPGAVVPGGGPAAPGGGPAPLVAPLAGSGKAADPKGFTLEGAGSAKEALARLFLFASAKLAQGPQGHLELFQTLDREIFAKETELEALFGDEAAAARQLYPVIRFLADRDAQVIDMTETVFRTMAEDPAFFEKADKDTLEVFTEGMGAIVAGAVPEERLATFRAHAKKVLDTPEDRQPEALRRNRRRVEQVLALWAPDLSPEQARERLRASDLSPREALALLRRLPPAELQGFDVAALGGPLLDQGDFRSIRDVASLALDAGTLARLDDRVIEAAASGRLNASVIPYWLRESKREKWADARPFVEQGLRRGAQATDAFALSLGQLAERPPSDQVSWILSSFQVSERVAKSVKAQFRLP